MLLETVEDNGLRAIEQPANPGEERRGERQGQTKLGSVAILTISLNSPHQQTPSPQDAPTPLTDFILLSWGLQGEPDSVWKLHLGNGLVVWGFLFVCWGFVCF